ncbi:hypothetical protein LCGC14_1258760, partial [marine sediment metagenome]
MNVRLGRVLRASTLMLPFSPEDLLAPQPGERSEGDLSLRWEAA